MINISTYVYYTERVNDKCFENTFETCLESKFRKISLENKFTTSFENKFIKTVFEKLIYKKFFIILCISALM